MTGELGSLGNNTGATGVGYFGDIIRYSCVYPKFVHMNNNLVVALAKVLVERLRIEAVYHSRYDWKNKAVWACRVCVILIKL